MLNLLHRKQYIPVKRRPKQQHQGRRSGSRHRSPAAASPFSKLVRASARYPILTPPLPSGTLPTWCGMPNYLPTCPGL
jgi:hypothetical protein